MSKTKTLTYGSRMFMLIGIIHYLFQLSDLFFYLIQRRRNSKYVPIYTKNGGIERVGLGIMRARDEGGGGALKLLDSERNKDSFSRHILMRRRSNPS